MTDFHTHVLPQLDDGAQSVEIAAEMLKKSHLQGVDTVLATSHYYGKNRSPESFVESRNNSYELLEPYIPEGMTVKLGAEFYLSERASISTQDLDLLCIEGTRCLLVELPFVKKWERCLYDRVYGLIEEGYLPILAHVDRYAAFIDKPSRLLEFMEMGCLLQVNASAFLEKPVKNFALTLLKKGYVHCIGTDMHDLDLRGQNMSAAREAAFEEGLEEEWERAQQTMQALLSGEEIEIAFPSKIKKVFGRFY